MESCLATDWANESWTRRSAFSDNSSRIFWRQRELAGTYYPDLGGYLPFDSRGQKIRPLGDSDEHVLPFSAVLYHRACLAFPRKYAIRSAVARGVFPSPAQPQPFAGAVLRNRRVTFDTSERNERG
jgi:hypothetical protein